MVDIRQWSRVIQPLASLMVVLPGTKNQVEERASERKKQVQSGINEFEIRVGYVTGGELWTQG